jgi:hypothetical protein
VLFRSPIVGVLWTLEAARWVAFPAVAYLCIDLALSVPEGSRPGSWRRARGLALAATGLGVLAALLEALPPLSLGGFTLLIPARIARAPELIGALGVLAALVIRTSRTRTLDRAEPHAENAWAQLGLVPGAVVALIVLLAARYPEIDLAQPWFWAALCLSALILVRAHVLLVDARYRLAVGTTARRAIEITLLALLMSVLVYALRDALPSHPLDLALWVSLGVLLAFGVQRVTERVLRRWLAPAGGALLDALATATQRLCDVGSLADIGAAVLPPLRAASSTSDGLVLLYAFDPEVEVSIDAAGQPRLSQALPPQALTEQVHAQIGRASCRERVS